MRTDYRCRSTLGTLLVVALLGPAIGTAEPVRVLPAGQLPQDKRLLPLTTLNGYFPFTPCPTRQAWEKRAERVRRQVLVATGLWPMPTATPLNPVIHGRIDRQDYSVEKVFFESYPGHFVTGNLYRPKGRSGRLPGVLSPHGHWPNGRFHDAGTKGVRQQIAEGAERFEVGGRSPLQARCVQLARMGCVVFHYDMVGYADSQQIPHGGTHAAPATPDQWVYCSPQAELRLQNIMGLQTYNSIRAMDFLSALTEVDPQRIAVTGASGGGTQTFMLCGVDPRPAVAFPAVMVSTAMQGGCTCENACYLRVETGNIELAALTAPRPLGMTAANDWTREIETKGLPELKQHYKILGVPSLVMAKPLLHFPHNYNSVSRTVMYHWLNKHLKLGVEEPIIEADYPLLSQQELTVWDDAHPKPRSGADYERSLLQWITEDSQRQMAALTPKDAEGLQRYRAIVGGAMDVMIGRSLPASGLVTASSCGQLDRGTWRLEKILIRYALAGEEAPALRLQPKSWNKRAVVWIDKSGKQGLFDSDGAPKAAVQKLLDAGVAVVGVDLFGQGEFTADGKPMDKNRLNDGQRRAPYAGYTYGYNHPLLVQRVHDILSVVAVLTQGDDRADVVDLVGLAGTGHLVAVARTQAGETIRRAAMDSGGLRFASLAAVDDADFLPGAVKYGDVPGMLALSAPSPMWLAGEGNQAPALVGAAYQATGKPENLTIFSGPAQDAPLAVVTWLLK